MVISLNKPLKSAKGNVLGIPRHLSDSIFEPGKQAVFDNEMTIEGWPFVLEVPEKKQTSSYSNVLIFKFCKGTMLDRLQAPKLWTQADDFNAVEAGGLNNLSAWLTDYVQEGIDKSKAEEIGRAHV